MNECWESFIADFVETFEVFRGVGVTRREIEPDWVHKVYSENDIELVWVSVNDHLWQKNSDLVNICELLLNGKVSDYIWIVNETVPNFTDPIKIRDKDIKTFFGEYEKISKMHFCNNEDVIALCPKTKTFGMYHHEGFYCTYSSM